MGNAIILISDTCGTHLYPRGGGRGGGGSVSEILTGGVLLLFFYSSVPACLCCCDSIDLEILVSWFLGL